MPHKCNGEHPKPIQSKKNIAFDSLLYSQMVAPLNACSISLSPPLSIIVSASVTRQANNKTAPTKKDMNPLQFTEQTIVPLVLLLSHSIQLPPLFFLLSQQPITKTGLIGKEQNANKKKPKKKKNDSDPEKKYRWCLALFFEE
jgi:hypothetical protein